MKWDTYKLKWVKERFRSVRDIEKNYGEVLSSEELSHAQFFSIGESASVFNFLDLTLFHSFNMSPLRALITRIPRNPLNGHWIAASQSLVGKQFVISPKSKVSQISERNVLVLKIKSKISFVFLKMKKKATSGGKKCKFFFYWLDCKIK